MELYNHQLLERKMNIRKYRNHHKQKDGKSSTQYFCDDILTFDIEVTSAWIDENNNIIGYEKGFSSDYWNSLKPLALPYIWQFSINDEVYYGREFNDFINVLNDIKRRKLTCIIWVHNLAYEFQFLCNILTWKSVFAKTPHKPMKCVSNEYPNIEFRCTYMLTRLSLESWGKQIGMPKKVGDLDYEKIRTPLSQLNDKEIGYCERDCIVVYKGIKKYIEKYDNQWKIPLTQTGTVRQVVKELLFQDETYSKKIKRLVPKSAEEYKRLQQVFAGGYTHANRKYAGIVIEDYIEHYDFASSYPTVMIAEKYPMQPWTTTTRVIEEELFDDYAFIYRIVFYDIETKSYNTYLQLSKCIHFEKTQLDNGRILKAKKVELYITEQDYITLNNNYTWEKIEIVEAYKSKKGYLPTPFVDYILQLYENKTELKDVDGMEDLYLQSKQYINALFGMMVTAIIQANVTLEDDIWSVEKLTEFFIDNKLNQLSSSNPREKRYFLSYSWGCWVTAYARRNLWKCIEKCDKDMIYCDTDSIFVIGKHDFTWYNNEIVKKLQIACEYHNIDFNRTRPKAPDGKICQLGIFDAEKPCNEFITLGAKRYVERRIEDNKLHLTVSGINKEAVALLRNDIYNFKDGFLFDKDGIVEDENGNVIYENYECVNKRLLSYLNSMPSIKYPDGYISTYKYGINMRRNGYKLSVTDEYDDLLNFMQMSINDIPEESKIMLKGFFRISKKER